MADQSGVPRQAAVTLETVVTVDDPAALEQAAVADINETVFDADDDAQEQARQAACAQVRGDPVAALLWLIDPHAAFDRLSGVSVGVVQQAVGPVDPTDEDDDDGDGGVSRPDFAGLFEVCECGRESCARCVGFQVTPRTAAVVWTAAQLLADGVYDDVEEHGDDPVTDARQWSVLDRYPPVTFGRDAVWRRQAARAFDDLTEDIEAGQWPLPKCFAEEMALHLILEDAEHIDEIVDFVHLSDTLDALPEHPDDLDWEGCSEMLFQDHDVLMLFDQSLDGIEDPDAEQNRSHRIGDMRPAAWFTTFANMTPRDGRRPFRR